jgi:hypothetical protein
VAVTTHEQEHAGGYAAPPRPSGWRRWTAPGWLRVLWVVPLSFILSALLVLGARAALGYESAGFGALNPFGDNFFEFGNTELQVLVVVWLVVVPL